MRDETGKILRLAPEGLRYYWIGEGVLALETTLLKPGYAIGQLYPVTRLFRLSEVISTKSSEACKFAVTLELASLHCPLC